MIDLKLQISKNYNFYEFYRILMRIYKGDDFIGYRPKSHSPSVPGFKILSFYSRASMILFLSQSTTPALPLTRILGVVKTCCFSSLRLEINQWGGRI